MRKTKFDDKLKMSNIRKANNEEMIRGLMLTVSHMIEHVNGIHQMLKQEINEIIKLKVDNKKSLHKPTSEDEETNMDENMDEEIESEYEPEKGPSEDKEDEDVKENIWNEKNLVEELSDRVSDDFLKEDNPINIQVSTGCQTLRE